MNKQLKGVSFWLFFWTVLFLLTGSVVVALIVASIHFHMDINDSVFFNIAKQALMRF